MAKLLDGLALSRPLLQSLKLRIDRLSQAGLRPKLVIIGVGTDRAFQVYVRQKIQKAKEIGLVTKLLKIPSTISKAAACAEIKEIERTERAHGVIIQLPLPHHWAVNEIVNLVDPARDVDGLTAVNSGRLYQNWSPYFVPPTVAAILDLVKAARVSFSGKYFVLIGAGPLVGRPLVSILLAKQATLSVVNVKTVNLPDFTGKADVIICGAGKPNLIMPNMVKKGVTIIDAGFSLVGGKPVGDVNFAELVKSRRPQAITPPVGGVGPLTVAYLLANTVKAAERKSAGRNV